MSTIFTLLSVCNYACYNDFILLCTMFKNSASEFILCHKNRAAIRCWYEKEVTAKD